MAEAIEDQQGFMIAQSLVGVAAGDRLRAARAGADDAPRPPDRRVRPPLSIYLVRHGKAGHRETWAGDDDTQRPLTKAGRRQAEALADRLADAGVKTLWSSPYVRCVQTLEPLAERLGLPIETDDRLAEGAPVEDTLELIREAGDGAVLCTHGDVLTDAIERARPSRHRAHDASGVAQGKRLDPRRRR